MKKYFIVGLLLCLPVVAHAEDADLSGKSTLEEDIPKFLLNNKYKKFFTFTLENDSMGGGTDSNYTNGLLLTYYDVGAEPPRIAKWLDKFLPTFKINDSTSTHYSIGHNLYTPDVITTNIPDPNDRPYAGYLYGSAGFTSITENHLDEVSATVGIIGPAALGKQIQNSVHKVVNGRDANGWDSQLENELGLGVSWQRSWPRWRSDNFGGDFYYRIAPHVGATLGNVYTYANAGIGIQVMPDTQKWQAPPLRVRPAIPGSGIFTTGGKKWSWMAFAGVDGRVMGRNIFLDGNTFEDSPSVDKNYAVADASTGVAFALGRSRVSYTLNWRSKEFEEQQNDQLFGVISYSYRF